MNIANMLAGGYSPTPIEPYGNALARAQALRGGQMQQQMMALQLQQAQRQQELQQANALRDRQFRESIPSPQMAASQAALAGGGGPTVANAQRMQPVDPRVQLLHGAMRAGGDPMAYINAAYPKPEPMVVAEGGTVIDKNKPGAGALFSAPPKPAPGTADMQNYAHVRAQGYRGTFDQFLREQANLKAPKTTVNVGQDGLGLKPKDRFDMEGKLADDYRSATKMDGLVLSAVSKIKTSLEQTGAVKDQAAIYSFAKMLDPDGAVREADYEAITNTAGLLDRIKNSVNRLKTGEQLSPTQRQEMLTMMTAFEEVANRRIAAVQASFSDQAKRYNLRPESVYGAPVAPQGPKNGTPAATTVRTPDGQVHTFPTPAAAAAFKREAGL